MDERGRAVDWPVMLFVSTSEQDDPDSIAEARGRTESIAEERGRE